MSIITTHQEDISSVWYTNKIKHGLCDFLIPSDGSKNTNSYQIIGKETEDGRRWAVEKGKKEAKMATKKQKSRGEERMRGMTQGEE